MAWTLGTRLQSSLTGPLPSLGQGPELYPQQPACGTINHSLCPGKKHQGGEGPLAHVTGFRARDKSAKIRQTSELVSLNDASKLAIAYIFKSFTPNKLCKIIQAKPPIFLHPRSVAPFRLGRIFLRFHKHELRHLLVWGYTWLLKNVDISTANKQSFVNGLKCLSPAKIHLLIWWSRT